MTPEEKKKLVRRTYGDKHPLYVPSLARGFTQVGLWDGPQCVAMFFGPMAKIEAEAFRHG